MRVVITGASGLVGSALVAGLRQRGDEVTALSRDPDAARANLGVEAAAWNPLEEPAPADAVAGRDAVVHLAGETVAQRWSGPARERIRDSRVVGTRNLVAGLAAVDPRPSALVAASAVGYYGARGDERLDESARPGDGFLAQVCVEWEAEAARAAELGMRVVTVRTGVALSRTGGALAAMLPFFRAGLGGPVAGGDQYVPWIGLDDLVGIYLAGLDDERWEGPVNACAPEPATNRELSKALGRVLRRPAVLPAPGLALRALYGEMSIVVTGGQRAIPARALGLGYRFRHVDLDEGLRSALRR